MTDRGLCTGNRTDGRGAYPQCRAGRKLNDIKQIAGEADHDLDASHAHTTSGQSQRSGGCPISDVRPASTCPIYTGQGWSFNAPSDEVRDLLLALPLALVTGWIDEMRGNRSTKIKRRVQVHARLEVAMMPRVVARLEPARWDMSHLGSGRHLGETDHRVAVVLGRQHRGGARRRYDEELALGSRHACAIPADGTLWCWGDARLGATGDAAIVGIANDKAPFQVGTDTDWAHVAAGTDFTCALKTDHTRWCFGDDLDGELGNGLAWRKGFAPIAF